jgi:glyoxylase-like metal-dependent hydrolase (beta-lactamase superfamily II)
MEKEGIEDYGVVKVASDLFYIRTLIVNVCFAGKPKENHWEKPDWVLIDAGLAGTAGKIKDAAGVLYGKENPPKAVILTHAHFDHIGTLEELLKGWQVPVFAHPQEIPYLTGKESYPPPDPSVSDGLMAKISPLYPRDPVDIGQSIQTLPEDGSVPFMPGWRWIAAPGHTPGQVVLFRDIDGVLIAGDAFTTVKQESALAVMTQKEEVHAPPGYFTMNWEEAGKSIRRVAQLNPQVVITGHGKPMSGEELKTELRELSEDFERDSIPEHGKYVEHPVPMEASYAQTREGDEGKYL